MRKVEKRGLSDGSKLTITQHPCTEGFSLGTKLAPIIIPILANIEDLDGFTMESDIKEILPMIIDFVAELEKRDSMDLLTQLFRHTVIDFVIEQPDGKSKKVNMGLGSKDVMDEALSLRTLFEAIWYSVEVNYVNFFPVGVIKSSEITPSEVSH